MSARDYTRTYSEWQLSDGTWTEDFRLVLAEKRVGETFTYRQNNAISTMGRDQRQAEVLAWAKECFGEAEATSLTQRGLRLLEEAAEAFQAAGGSVEMARKLVDFVFERPVGEIKQEIGGVSVTLLALAAAAGVSADACEVDEIVRCLSKPIEHFTARNAAKNAAGLLAIKDK